MYKTLIAINRRSDLTFDAFTQYWRSEHATLVRRLANDLGIVRYVQLHLPRSVTNKAENDDRPYHGYDGIAEVWYESESAFRTAFKSEKGRKAAALLAYDEKNFMNGNGVMIFRGDETVVLNN